jgi:hypothetical protein
MVRERLAPPLLPPLIADGGAQGEHGVDMAALPMHPCSFEANFDDVFVGTLHHARADGPALVSKLRVVHQGFALAQVVQVLLDALALRQFAPQLICQAQERAGTSMFENV